VDITAPAHSAANILAKYLPRIDSDQGASAGTAIKTDSRGLDERLTELLQKNPKVAKLLNAKRSDKIRLFDDGEADHGDIKAGDGIYSNAYKTTQIPGNYQFRLKIAAASACGRVERSEVTSTLIGARTFDRKTSYLTAKAMGKDQYAILVQPQDRFGNLLGPGHGQDIQIAISSGHLKGGWHDYLDGVYQQIITVNPGDNPRINIQIKGISFVQTNLLTLRNVDRKLSGKPGMGSCNQTKN